MSKELPFFKFEPAQWVFGRINKQSKEVKVAFIELICKYWNDSCVMTIEDAKLDYGEKEVETLLKNRIVKDIDSFIRVSFLDEQLEEIEAKSSQASKAGKKSAEIRAKRKANEAEQKSNGRSTVVQQNPTDKIREDKIREDKIITTKGENYSKAVIDCCISCIQFFDDHLKPTTKSQKNKWLDTIDKLNRIDGIPFNQIIDVVRKTRSDEFWSKNFLSITKLRKKNKDDVSYVVVFNEKFKSNEKSRLEKFVKSDGSNRYNEFFGEQL